MTEYALELELWYEVYHPCVYAYLEYAILNRTETWIDDIQWTINPRETITTELVYYIQTVYIKASVELSYIIRASTVIQHSMEYVVILLHPPIETSLVYRVNTTHLLPSFDMYPVTLSGSHALVYSLGYNGHIDPDRSWSIDALPLDPSYWQYYFCSSDPRQGYGTVPPLSFPWWVTYRYYTPTHIDSYTMSLITALGEPRSWTFSGSDNEIDWVVLDTQTNYVWSWVYSCQLSSTRSFRAYRLTITDTWPDGYQGRTLLIQALLLYSAYRMEYVVGLVGPTVWFNKWMTWTINTTHSVTIPLAYVVRKNLFTLVAESIPDGIPSNVKFNAAYVGWYTPVSWYWEFGDGVTRTTNTPIVYHQYTVPGTYTVTCTLTTNPVTTTGNVKSIQVVINDDLVVPVDFTSDVRTGTFPLTVHFINLTADISGTTWTWTFGDGYSSYDRNPTHTYAEGTYDVTLQASSSQFSSTLCREEYIYVTGDVLPVAGFIVTAGGEIVGYTGPTVYVVSLTVTDRTGHVSTSTQNVRWDGIHPVKFKDTSTGDIVSWKWNYGHLIEVDPRV
jgi:PKD repeat protein